MGTSITVRGTVITGLGEGASFTQLDWVRAQFEERLGIDPYPGTLNLRLDEPAELEQWRRLKAESGVVIEPARPEFCEAIGFPARATAPDGRQSAQAGDGQTDTTHQPVAIIIPDVPEYPDAQVELIAPVNLREALGVGDGDAVRVTVEVHDRE